METLSLLEPLLAVCTLSLLPTFHWSKQIKGTDSRSLNLVVINRLLIFSNGPEGQKNFEQVGRSAACSRDGCLSSTYYV